MTTPTPNPASEHGIDRTPIRYLVLAGSYSIYNKWKQQQEIPMGEAFYVSSAEVLRGRRFSHKEVKVVELYGFWDRKDANEIMTMIDERFL